MILPSKHISHERALLTTGARILEKLTGPQTVSALWEKLLIQNKTSRHSNSPIGYDQFVLALDLLFMIGAIELTEGLVKRRNHDSSHL
jgi:hypothetical protein